MNRALPSCACAAIFIGAMVLTAQDKPEAAPAGSGPILVYTATTDNVSGAPDSIRIDLFRWSTDAEHDQLVAAWNMTGSGSRGGGGGRGGRGGRGRGPAAIDPNDPALNPDGADAPAAGARGRGRGRGAEAPEAPKPTPEGSLAAELKQAGTVGYLWSSEIAGYSLKYATKISGPNGDRVILITDRRLGGTNDLWKPAGAADSSPYDFSVIELRLNAKGQGEGKASLIGKVTLDSTAKVVALEDYSALPVVLKNVKPRPAAPAQAPVRDANAPKRKI